MSIADLPLSQDLLNYYRSRLEKSEADYAAAIAKIDSLQLSHEQFHKSQWELLKRESEINELQKELSDYKDFAFEERKKLLNVLAENDTLKIQELKDRKKIRYLLSISGTSPHETTYFRDQLDKRLVKIGKENAIPEEGRKRVKKDVQDKSAPEQHDQHKIHSADREVVILEDEIEGLKLTVLGLQTQLDEQRSFYEQSIAQLKRDKEFHFQEHQAWFEQQSQKCEELLDSNRKLRSLCRENTRELLHTKKSARTHDRQLIEEKNKLIDENVELKSSLQKERIKVHEIEKSTEIKVNRKHDVTISELRSKNKKQEEEIKTLKSKLEDINAQYQKKFEQLQSRSDSAMANFLSLKKRRDFEIEGFTNDILLLRKQLKVLERSILKYSPLEDKELLLLGLAQATGKRVSQMSSTLQGLKAKVYQVENDMRTGVAV